MIKERKKDVWSEMMTYKILVVEDDKNIIEIVEEYLLDAEYTVLTAEDGKEAKKIIDEIGDIDLYILDIMLPGMTGLELLKYIRQDKDMPVIMLTALDDEFTQVLSFDGLADDYVTKPFSPKLLVKRVEAQLRRYHKKDNKIQMGNITLDLDSYEAYEGEEKMNLTLKELKLLEVLMQHKGKVLNRQQLLNYVWGYDYFGDERIVDAHIKNIRKKFNTNLIVTVKGVGYKIEKM